jgi:hypothetical protein
MKYKSKLLPIISAATILTIIELTNVLQCLSTPIGAFVTAARKTETPGLYIVDFVIIQPPGDSAIPPVIHKVIKFRYRIYCPDKTVRNITNKWGKAIPAANDSEAGTGSMVSIVQQTCNGW